MKFIFRKIIKKYQSFSKNSTPKCKYSPTCSNYALDALDNHNIFKATFLIFYRFIRCNPFSKGGYDPINKKKK